MQPVIKRCIQIHGGGLKKGSPWSTADFHTVDGVEFISLQKRDSGLNRFVTGSSSTSLRDTAFLDELRKKRNIEMIMQNDEPSLFGTKPAHGPKLGQYKMRQMQAANRNNEKPGIIELQMPAVEFDGEVAAAISLKVKAPASDRKGDGVCIELTTENLHYIRIALRVSQGTKNYSRTKPGLPSNTGCRWVKRGKRCGYLATRKPDGCEMQSRFFSSTKHGDDAVVAHKWMQFESDEDGGGQDDGGQADAKSGEDTEHEDDLGAGDSDDGDVEVLGEDAVQGDGVPEHGGA